jgi:hypothetical protein
MDGVKGMIECQLCEEYFEEEDMTECPECLKEMCESCYEMHVPICFYVSEHDNSDIDS